ncbi:MAG: ribosomal subunit interface protein [Candidatus Lloydbacteria bacterium RIFCSPHIGHO2_01_FULL_41_20]|uniref:Ribosomal subunit interface protein n=1 Tax=Candidatus Lloydbacteria bacterium RIFCSPHIGHO2_01_FULL_41_20 TaxID=1798657 RepID=A0A1G2CSK4_9BACT|nr:MAG: ribosomal subunit interface protein [Candidatus Lloydbacteria bacterium RIFCSPHIGHO2_01_FULL_41_20]
MNIKIQATNLELTSAIKQYVEKRLAPLERLLGAGNTSVRVEVEVGKISRHHKQGEVFMAEINIYSPIQDFRVVSEQEDLYTAIDDAKEEIEREIVSYKDKKRTLFRRGAVIVKDIIKGFGKFKWKRFTRLPRMPRRKN